MYFYSSWVTKNNKNNKNKQKNLKFYIKKYTEAGEGLAIIPNWTIDSVNLYKNAKQVINLCKEEALTFSFVIEIFCKNFQTVRFCFDDIEPAKLLRFQLGRACFSLKQRDCFAFMNKSYLTSDTIDGWKVYSLDREFCRMQLDKNEWRVSSINKNYTICESYPPRVIVPALIGDKSEFLFKYLKERKKPKARKFSLDKK